MEARERWQSFRRTRNKKGTNHKMTRKLIWVAPILAAALSACTADSNEEANDVTEPTLVTEAEDPSTLVISLGGCSVVAKPAEVVFGSYLHARADYLCSPLSAQRSVCVWLRINGGDWASTEDKVTVSNPGGGVGGTAWSKVITISSGIRSAKSCAQLFMGGSCSGSTHSSPECS